MRGDPLTHGHTCGKRPTPEYRTWHAMIQRCTYEKHEKYPRYGGRGIKVCDRWLNSFEAFLEDMGPRPPGTTLDRKDNDGHYEPGNCRWATDEEQANKRSNNRLVEYNGETKTMAEWARQIGLSAPALQSRLDRGWPLELAMDPNSTRQGKAKAERADRIAAEKESRHEMMICEECGTPFPRKTTRSRCCSNACRKRLTKREFHDANKERINASRRAKRKAVEA